MGREFRDFILRGNVVDLAVAVVIGAAFSGIVNSLVADMITPLIAAIRGQPNFAELTFEINNSEFFYGNFINSLISFLIIAAVVFLFVVKPVNALLARVRRPETAAEPTTRKCPECMSDIPLGARRCPFCTSVLEDGGRPVATAPSA